MKIYGYARISSEKQKMERQISNLTKFNPNIKIFSESVSGRSLMRPQWIILKSKLKSGDTVVFDSVSRMSRSAEDGIKLYFDLVNFGVNLIFLKERHIDSDSYKEALKRATGMDIDFNTSEGAEGELVSDIFKAVMKFMISKVEGDIYKAFEQSQKEVDDLRERTKEGIREAKLRGEMIGRPKGKPKKDTKKAIQSKKDIKNYSKTFNGHMSDKDLLRMLGLSRNTYFKYKKDLKEEMENTTEV